MSEQAPPYNVKSPYYDHFGEALREILARALRGEIKMRLERNVDGNGVETITIQCTPTQPSQPS